MIRQTEIPSRLKFNTMGFNYDFGVWCFKGFLVTGPDIENDCQPLEFYLNVNPNTGEAKVGEKV